MKENLVLHNRFDVSVVDAKTGEVKQTAVGFNIITNKFFAYRLGDQKTAGKDYRIRDILNCIGVGTGEGVPAVTDTVLFKYLKRKLSSTVKEHYEYPTSYRTIQIKLEANECVGEHITEVGIFYNTNSNYLDRDSSNQMMTHAMLQDSEGNPIAIDKTDTDVVFVNATFFCTISLTGFGNNALFPNPENNYLVRWVLFGTMNNYISVGTMPISEAEQLTLNYGDRYKSYQSFYKNFDLRDGTEDMEELRLDFPLVTLLDGEANNHIARYFGNPGIGLFCFPNQEVFPPYQVDHLAVGEGDGVTQDFAVKCPLIQAGTARVFVGGDELPASEFEFNYENNCIDALENYPTASLSAFDDCVEIGDLKRQGKAIYTYRDPLLLTNYQISGKYPGNCYITEESPAWFDLGEPRECNCLKIFSDINKMQDAYIANLVIQCSDDNENWTTVEATCADQVWKWPLVIARYWRFYVPSQRWYFYLTRSAYNRDGVSCGCALALGKTVPGLRLKTPPMDGQTVQVSYAIDVPYKTSNNIIRFAMSVQLQRGA